MKKTNRTTATTPATRTMTIAALLRMRQVDAWQRLCLQQWPATTVVEVIVHATSVEIVSDAPKAVR